MAESVADLGAIEKVDVSLYLQYLRKMSDEQLLQAEKDVLSLVEHPGWVFVQGIIAQAIEASTARMRYADPKEPAAMWRDIGMQAGMDSARQVTRAVVLKAQKRQEEIAKQVQRREATAAAAEA